MNAKHKLMAEMIQHLSIGSYQYRATLLSFKMCSAFHCFSPMISQSSCLVSKLFLRFADVARKEFRKLPSNRGAKPKALRLSNAKRKGVHSNFEPAIVKRDWAVALTNLCPKSGSKSRVKVSQGNEQFSQPTSSSSSWQLQVTDSVLDPVRQSNSNSFLHTRFLHPGTVVSHSVLSTDRRLGPPLSTLGWDCCRVQYLSRSRRAI